jgi:hypothetical protein
MLLSDVVGKDGRIWVKSEWGPASDYWPAVSFSKRTVGDYLRQEFRPGRDVIVYIGTSNPATTERPEHRQRLLSAVNIEPKQIIETRDCIPAESWEKAQKEFRGRWLWSMPALDIWEIAGFPLAHDLVPVAYRQLGQFANRGKVVELDSQERDAAHALEVAAVDFVRPKKAAGFRPTRSFLDLSPEIRREIGRMAAGILNRVDAGGTERVSTNPIRTMNEPDLHIMLGTKWLEQEGRCFLCQGPLVPGTKNYLLQASPDRTDSQDAAYSKENTRITHLGCNLAKNKVTLAEFEDWLSAVRGELLDEEADGASVE